MRVSRLTALCAAIATAACSLVVSLDSLTAGDAGDASVDCGVCPGTPIATTSTQPGLAAVGGLVAWSDPLAFHYVYEDGGAYATDAPIGPTTASDPYTGEMASKGATFLSGVISGSSGDVYACSVSGSCGADMNQLHEAFNVVADGQGSYTDTLDGLASCNAATACGGSFTLMVPYSAGPFVALALSATRIFWSTGAGGTIQSVLRDAVIDASPSITTFVSGQQNTQALASDSTSLYWVEFDAGKIHSCPLAGCTTPALVYGGTAYSGLGRMVSDGAYLYFLATSPGALLACPVSGCAGEPTLVMGGLQNPQRIALSTHDVVVADWTMQQILTAPRL